MSAAGGVVIVLGLLGVTVANARELRRADTRSRPRVAADFLVTSLAWPFFLPSILAGEGAARRPATRDARPEARRIDRAESALGETLAELDGVALEALRGELPRIRGLAGGLRPWVDRLAAMEAELARPESSIVELDAALAALAARGVPDHDPRVGSLRARRASLVHLASLRQRSAEELERALLELEELTTELRVLRFAGEGPGSESIERLRHLALRVAAVRDALAPAP